MVEHYMMNAVIKLFQYTISILFAIQKEKTTQVMILKNY